MITIATRKTWSPKIPRIRWRMPTNNRSHIQVNKDAYIVEDIKMQR